MNGSAARFFGFVLAGCISGCATAQHDASIEAIADATAGARVIFLGEPDHGDGGSMTARAELTEHLYKHAGVRWVIFESSVFDARRVDRALDDGADPVPTVAEGVLDIWGGAAQLDGLFTLIGESRSTDRPLRLAGMDATPVGPLDRCLHCEDLAARFEAAGDAAPEGWRSALDGLAAWYIGFDRTKRAERPVELVERLERLADDAMSNGHLIEDAPLIDRALRGWAIWIRGVTPKFPLTETAINERDAMMAEQLLALLAGLPEGERAVVWLHNVHAFRDLPSFWDADGNELDGFTVPVAQIVAERLGDDAYCLGLASASGATQASWNPEPRVIDLPPESLEHRLLDGTDDSSVFVNFRRGVPQAAAGELRSGMVSFMDLRADWDAAFDGVWVLAETEPVRRRDE